MSSIVTAILIAAALLFETSYHAVHESSHSSYHYGELHDFHNNDHDVHGKDANGNLKHPRLISELINRMGGEFMSLGFLAFVIFLCSNLGGFEALARDIGSSDYESALSGSSSSAYAGEPVDWHYPATEIDWLHTAEIVHIKLFVGMLLYFIVVYCLVTGSVETIRAWEILRIRVLQDAKESDEQLLDRCAHDDAFIDFIKLGMYFCDKVIAWEETRPPTWERLLRKLSIDRECVDVHKQVMKSFEEHFSLSAYLATNVEEGVCDSIKLHISTWCALMVLFCIFSIFHRYLKIRFMHIAVFIVVFAFVVLLLMWLQTWRQLKIIRHHVHQEIVASMQRRDEKAADPDRRQLSKNSDGSASRSPPERLSQVVRAASGEIAGNLSVVIGNVNRVNQRVNTEKYMLRTLQVFIFLISQVTADTLFDFASWRSEPSISLVQSLAFILLYIVLALFIRTRVPMFLALMACPPYVDEENFEVLISVLGDHSFSKTEQTLGSPRSEDAAVSERKSVGPRSGSAPAGASNLELTLELAALLGVRSELEARMRTIQGDSCAGADDNFRILRNGE